jgi:hypothetical protein
MRTEDQLNLTFLSPEQADTDRLIRQLLGTAVADRYVDFCRLASGTLPLIVSRPLAGHALRELDSLVRRVLATPMEAKAFDNAEEKQRRAKARAKLKALGFDEPALQRAEKALKPEYSHKKEMYSCGCGSICLHLRRPRVSGRRTTGTTSFRSQLPPSRLSELCGLMARRLDFF